MKAAKSSVAVSKMWLRTSRQVQPLRQTLNQWHAQSSRFFTTSVASHGPEMVSTCPDPTCPCADMPADLDIDREKPLDGTMPAFDEHVVIRTGVSDWTSRIEDDERFPLVKMLKQRLGRGGKFHDPFRNNMLTTSSSPSSSPSILLFPSFRAITNLHATPAEDDLTSYATKTDALIRGFLLPTQPSKFPHATFAKEQQEAEKNMESSPATVNQLLRDPAATEMFEHHAVQHLTVLICGHNARDSRCGIVGPLLQTQFNDVLERKGWTLGAGSDAGSADGGKAAAVVEMISHVGGHKFAGNVILYVPTGGRWAGHPLAGKGVWYGRVEPRHVEGIVEQTVERGVVIKELFRGGMGKDREMIRL